jgi:hypothetical protein
LLSKTLNIKIYRTIIFSVVLYGCETWSLTLREERRLRVFENRVLRRIFRCKRDEVAGKWRKLHNDNDLYFSPYIFWVIKSRRMRWAGYVARMGERTVAYRVLVGKAEGKSLLGIPGLVRRVIIKCRFRKGNGFECNGLNMLRVGRGGRFLWNGVLKF